MESFKDFLLDDINKLASLSIGKDETVFRMTMVDHAVVMDKPLSYTLGLEATPVKPVPSEAREWTMAIGTYKSGLPIMDKTWFGYWSMWNRLDKKGDGPYGYLVATDDTLDQLKTFNAIRADLVGTQFGIPQMFLPEIARYVDGDKEKYNKIYEHEGIPASEHVIGMLWVHDLQSYRAYTNWGPIDQSNRAKKLF